MRKREPLPHWCKEAKKAMIDKDMETIDLAQEIGCSRSFAGAIINGRAKSDILVIKISRILEINPPEGSIIFKQ